MKNCKLKRLPKFCGNLFLLIFCFYRKTGTIYLSKNITARPYTSGLTSLPRPVNSLIPAYDIIPNDMPSAIEYVAGIISMVMNAGKASVMSEKLISTTVDSINNPTTTRAAAVA